MRHLDTNLFEALIEQVETAVQVSGGLTNADRWIEANTRDPLNPYKNWSFAGHEWQRQVVNDTAPEVALRKATQIGASEVSLRLALAIVSKFAGISAIYTLPTIRFAQKFAMSRVDPVIKNSPKLSTLLSKEVSSNELKQIGNSFLYFGGCNSENSAISVPARALIIDELAFSQPGVVSIFASRLGHVPEHLRIIRKFSSPLYPHSDISAEFERGDQKSYWVYHTVCGQWVDTDVLELLKIPGFDQDVTELTLSDMDHRKVKPNEAFFQCPSCGHPISQANLVEPQYRAWVAKHPSREISSYDAGPLVLPQVRTPKALLNDLRRYKKTQTWIQFALGRPCESAGDTLLQAAIDRAFVINPVPPRSGGLTGGLIGVDVGKTSHAVYGKVVDEVLHVVYAETLRQDEDNATALTLQERFKQYVCRLLVVDAGPDITLAKTLQGLLPYNRALPCYFVRGRGKAAVGFYEIDEVEGVVKVHRTRAFDEFVGEFNRGKIRIARGLAVEPELRAHLTKLKRVMDYDQSGEEVAHWVSPDPENHFWLALFYLWLASKISGDELRIVLPGVGLSGAGLVRKVRVGSVQPTRP